MLLELLVAAHPTVGTTNQRQTATADFLDGLLRVGFLARLENEYVFEINKFFSIGNFWKSDQIICLSHENF